MVDYRALRYESGSVGAFRPWINILGFFETKQADNNFLRGRSRQTARIGILFLKSSFRRDGTAILKIFFALPCKLLKGQPSRLERGNREYDAV